MAATAPDLLFNLRNNFYLGAFQAAINNSDLPNLSPDDAVERDCLVYRSYIALGSYQVRLCPMEKSPNSDSDSDSISDLCVRISW